MILGVRAIIVISMIYIGLVNFFVATTMVTACILLTIYELELKTVLITLTISTEFGKGRLSMDSDDGVAGMTTMLVVPSVDKILNITDSFRVDGFVARPNRARTDRRFDFILNSGMEQIDKERLFSFQLQW